MISLTHHPLSMRRFALMLIFAALCAANAQAKHDWTVHPEQVKCKFTSNLKGWVVGMTVITNFTTIPPKGVYYPGIKIFTNLVARGAKLVCYNMWEGPEVGMDAELPFNIKKNSWYYKDEDDPTVSYFPDKRKFSYAYPQKEYSELDYCLVYNDTIYPVNVSAINSKLMYKSTLAEPFSEGFDIVDDEINMGLYSMQTNRWFIGDTVDLATANNIVYKGGVSLTNGCKVKVTFNAKSWALNYKITDPVGKWVVPGSNRELGVKWLKLDGREIKDGMQGDGFLFTNDVLVLYNYRGKKIEFKGGLDIMCPYGSTNIFESMDHSLCGKYGFCNFLGYGRVVFRGPETALGHRDCAMLLNETDSFNADDMPEVIVDNEYYISAPFELLIDGKSAMLNKEGPGWKYKHGSLYLNNFQGTNIYCDGYLKVFLEPNSKNTVRDLFDSGYGNIRFFGSENATLTVGSFDHSYGELAFSNITLNVTKEGADAELSIFSGNMYGKDSVINIFHHDENDTAMLYVASGNIALTNCILNVNANDDLAMMADGNLQLVDSAVTADGTLEISNDARLFDSQVTVGSAGDYSLRVFGNLLSSGSRLDLGSCLDVYGNADITGGTATLAPDDFGDAVSVQGLTKAKNAELNITGSASFLTNVYLNDCVCEIFSKETNAFLCDNTISLTKTKLKATSLTQALACKDFLANNCYILAETIRSGFGVVAETVTLKGRDGEIIGCVKCDEFLMESGNFTASGDVALEANSSVEFQGGNATLTGFIEAISCPFNVILADDSEEDLSGFKLIEIKNGFVMRKE